MKIPVFYRTKHVYVRRAVGIAIVYRLYSAVRLFVCDVALWSKTLRCRKVISPIIRVIH